MFRSGSEFEVAVGIVSAEKAEVGKSGHDLIHKILGDCLVDRGQVGGRIGEHGCCR